MRKATTIAAPGLDAPQDTPQLAAASNAKSVDETLAQRIRDAWPLEIEAANTQLEVLADQIADSVRPSLGIRISVIIPCYNAADHIAPCLEALARQTLPQEQFEVICVDDASTDDTVTILQNWAKKIPIFASCAIKRTVIKVPHETLVWISQPPTISLLLTQMTSFH